MKKIVLSTFVFFSISLQADDKEIAKRHLTFAEKMAVSLSNSPYLAKKGENGNFILKHSVGFMAENSEVDVPLTYADYYFIESLLRYKKYNINKK